MPLQFLLGSILFLLSAVFGGETSTSLTLAPIGNEYGQTYAGIGLPGLVVQKTWGS